MFRTIKRLGGGGHESDIVNCVHVCVPSLQLYENFVEEVDAVDNGISQCEGEARYAVGSTLSARVGHLNPRWNSKSQDTEVGGGWP